GNWQACSGSGEDRRRQDGQVLRGSVPARSALHQGTDHERLSTDRHKDRQAGREHLRPPLLPLQGRRAELDDCSDKVRGCCRRDEAVGSNWDLIGNWKRSAGCPYPALSFCDVIMITAIMPAI